MQRSWKSSTPLRRGDERETDEQVSPHTFRCVEMQQPISTPTAACLPCGFGALGEEGGRRSAFMSLPVCFPGSDWGWPVLLALKVSGVAREHRVLSHPMHLHPCREQLQHPILPKHLCPLLGQHIFTSVFLTLLLCFGVRLATL